MDREDASGASFDLLSEPWIPVLMVDGSEQRRSLFAIFDEAADIRAIACELPTQTFVVLRLLLAVLLRALGEVARPGAVWGELWRADRLPIDAVHRYLEAYRDRFDLFHPTTPFMQVAGLATAKGEAGGLDRLLTDANGFLTTRAGDGLTRMSFADAAIWLIHAHGYDVAGIHPAALGDPRAKGGKVYASDGLGTGYAGELGGVYAEGDDLRQTLLLNLVPGRTADSPFGAHRHDRPVWERPPLGASIEDRDQSVPHGPAELFTWQSRRVLLDHDGTAVTGVVLCYGDPLPARNLQAVEPMTAWRYSENQSKKTGVPIFMPVRHRPDRALWRGLSSLVALGSSAERQIAPAVVLEWIGIMAGRAALPETQLVRIHAVGIDYGTQSSVVTESMHDRLDLRIALLRATEPELYEVIDGVAKQTDAAAFAVGVLAQNLAIASGADVVNMAPRDAGTARAYAALDDAFRRWIVGLDNTTDTEAACDSWTSDARRILRELAEVLVREAGPAAWSGRWLGADDREQRLVNTPIAHRRFRAQLAKALPAAHPIENEAIA